MRDRVAHAGDASTTDRMPAHTGAAGQLDDVSAELAEVLATADRALDDWARFGAAVRAQVEREAATVGDAVASAVDVAVQRGLAAQLATVAGEIHKLEQRAKAASRALADHQVADRRWLVAVAAGVGVAIALLVALLVVVTRSPTTIVIPPDPQPIALPDGAR
jgi:ElaB/YqjD/DUF883 family membrane-anchored ribosome-binding protein|nr:hypothetical protein [Kofleriaceae bacterium]